MSHSHSHSEYIYLLQEREFIKTNEPIYKIGKSKQENLKRICNYPNGTKLLFQIICEKCDFIERELINIFKNKYELQRNIGNEYFKGDYKEMIDDIYKYISNNHDNHFDIDNIENVEIIDTYEKFMENTQIDKIIITNKKKEEGYLRYKGKTTFHKIWDKNSKDENSEILYLWLKHNSNNTFFCNFNYDKIIKDICNKCFIKNPNIYELQYYEFLIKNNNCHRFILNMKSFNLKKCDDIIIHDILVGNKLLLVSTELNINEIDINEFLLSFINDINIINQFRRLCYNVFIEQLDEFIIFSDYSNNNLLSILLNDVINAISSIYHPCGFMYEINDFNDRKLFKNKKPRLIFINNSNYTEKEIKKLGIKNIVIKYKSISYINIHYDINNYLINFLKWCSEYI